MSFSVFLCFFSTSDSGIICSFFLERNDGGIIIIYIDNLILGLPSCLAARPGHVKKQVLRACHQLGAIIKQGSEVFGKQVDWLGAHLDAEFKRFRIKSSFIENFSEFTKPLITSPKSFMTSTRSWYAILSSAIYASWISNGSLIFLDHLISWMSELGKSLSDQKITWDSMIPLSVSLLHHLPAMIREISSNPWRDPPLSSLNMGYRHLRCLEFVVSLGFPLFSQNEARYPIFPCPLELSYF